MVGNYKKPMPSAVGKILRFEKAGYTLHSNWRDSLWVEFSNFFKYAASVRGRDVFRNGEHLIRFKRYFEAYKNKVIRLQDSAVLQNRYVLPMDHRSDIISKIDKTAKGVLEKNVTVYDLMQLHLDTASILNSYASGKPVLFYTPRDCHAENALRPRPKHNDYYQALDKAIRSVSCKIDNKEDFLFLSEEVEEYIKNFCVDGENILYW